MTYQKQFKVKVMDQNGKWQVWPMKEWLRNNQNYVPMGMSPDSNTSHQLRNGLKKTGWEIEEDDRYVILVMPMPLSDSQENLEQFSENKIVDSVDEITFGLERDLQSALRINIDQLENGLKIIDGGQEHRTEAGYIDIMAEDDKGFVVIIELKAGIASPKAVAQVLSYMGAVFEENDKPVRGILVAGEFHKQVILASRAVPNLELKKYSFQFAFESIR